MASPFPARQCGNLRLSSSRHDDSTVSGKAMESQENIPLRAQQTTSDKLLIQRLSMCVVPFFKSTGD